MLWAEQARFLPGEGGAECQVAAGTLGGVSAAAPPPPDSWAADPANDVGVFYVTIPPGGRFVLPPAERAPAAVSRSAFFVEGPTAGPGAKVGGQPVPGGRAAVSLRADAACAIENDAAAAAEAQVLVLQGRPISARFARSLPLRSLHPRAPCACGSAPCSAAAAH